MSSLSHKLSLIVLMILGMSGIHTAGARVIVPLDGEWEIADSFRGDQMPTHFPSRGPVPGLTRSARPAFADVDKFDSAEVLRNSFGTKYVPTLAKSVGRGIPRQDRNYFWYAHDFTVPARKQVALLRIGLSQFGTAVWLNGQKLGEDNSCFSSIVFDATKALNWEGENHLVIRIGAHPAVLPLSVPSGRDLEKLFWTPGIYDQVELLLSDAAVITNIQVAPRIQSGEIVVQTEVENHSNGPLTFALEHTVRPWKQSAKVGRGHSEQVELAAGAKRVLTQTIAIANPRLWSPDDPFLYELETSSGGDTAKTRFGLREFRTDPRTQRAYLNGKAIYLRGSNITLHRFFEDADCGTLPWDEAWLQRLLVDIPQQMHWNAFRFCIGTVPRRWLEIADEAGLLIQYEYPLWTGPQEANFPTEWTAPILIEEFTRWMRDNWNHPCVVIWDACNETIAPILGREVIPAVRRLDLSNRPWDNGYNPPAGPNDPVESHPYEAMRDQTRPFVLSDLAQAAPDRRGRHTPLDQRAVIINEYGWLWLNRDGTPTELTRTYVYNRLLGPDATPAQRFDFLAYYLGGITEFWRAHRRMAGVLHFVYLTSSFPGAFTGDNFVDVKTLTLEPSFKDYVGEAFKPLGVYIHYWRPTHPAGVESQILVRMINDLDHSVVGQLTLAWEDEAGHVQGEVRQPFTIDALGATATELALQAPTTPGHYVLKANATPANPIPGGRTISRRRVTIE